MGKNQALEFGPTQAHAHFLKCFLENDMFLSLIIAQMVEWKLEQLEVKGHKLT